MVVKRIPPPPSLSSDDDHLTDDELVEESSSDDEQQTSKQEIKKPIQEAQSESEEGSGEDDEEEEEEDDEQQTPAQAKKPVTQKPEESDSDSEESGKTPHSPSASDFTVKPIATKPMVDLIKNKKPVKGNTVVVVAKPPVKRAIEVEGKNGAKDSKRKRVKVNNGDGGENEEKKSGGVNRLWSDDDEIAILQGIIDYRVKKGADPNADMGAFHDFIKDNLHVDVSKVKLADKIRRLKKKYLNNVEKSGEDPVFSKPHDCRSFELLKKIWGKGGVGEGGSVNGAKSDKKSGSKGGNGNAALAKLKDEGKAVAVKEKSKGKDEIGEGKVIVAKEKLKGKDEVNDGKALVVKEKPKGKDENKVANGDFAKMYPYLNSALEMQLETEPFRALSEEDRSLMKEKMVRNKKAQELNEGFKMLTTKELEVYLKRLELMKETTGIFLSALKSEE